MSKSLALILSSIAVLLANVGCSTRITAHNLDPKSKERAGIPFYLPKPYLVVAKNIRYVPTPTVGLTAPTPIPDAFDTSARELTLSGEIKQGRQLDLSRTLAEESKFERVEEDKRLLEEKITRLTEDKESLERRVENIEKKESQTSETTSNTNTGGGGTALEAESPKGSTPPETKDAPSGDDRPDGARGVAVNRQVLGVTNQGVVPASQIPDGLTPETFYTYQIIYLPDLTQKYGLEIHQGAGEFRGTMNLVNGWMHTGVGPMYMRDSTKAAQTFAAGAAVGNVIDSIAGLAFAGAGSKLPGATQSIPRLLPGMVGDTSGNKKESLKGEPSCQRIDDYAELYIFEPVVLGENETKRVEWRLLTATALSKTALSEDARGRDETHRGPWIRMRRDFFGAQGYTVQTNDFGKLIKDVREFYEKELKKTDGFTDVELDINTEKVLYRTSSLSEEQQKELIKQLKQHAQEEFAKRGEIDRAIREIEIKRAD